jgi:hypothetical protein
MTISFEILLYSGDLQYIADEIKLKIWAIGKIIGAHSSLGLYVAGYQERDRIVDQNGIIVNRGRRLEYRNHDA